MTTNTQPAPEAAKVAEEEELFDNSVTLRLYCHKHQKNEKFPLQLAETLVYGLAITAVRGVFVAPPPPETGLTFGEVMGDFCPVEYMRLIIRDDDTGEYIYRMNGLRKLHDEAEAKGVQL